MRFSLQNNTSYSNINVLYNSSQTSNPSLFSKRTEQYRYNFNGKELDTETGTIDFGARAYDARIGKWLSLDPLQDKYPDLSPYNFCNNNPIIFVDPDGQKINWFMSVGVLKLRKAYIRMGLKAEWKRLVNSPTKITVIVTKNILVSVNTDNNALQIQEGVSLNDPNNYEFNKVGEKPKQGFKTSILIISLGVFNLKKDIIEYYGVSEWATLTSKQRLDGIAKFQAKYQFMLNNQEIIKDVSGRTFELGGGKKKADSDYNKYSTADPLPNETEAEFLARVGGHEGDHSITASDNMRVSIIIKTVDKETKELKIDNFNKTQYDDLQEKSGYENEGKVIEKEQGERVKDDDQ